MTFDQRPEGSEGGRRAEAGRSASAEGPLPALSSQSRQSEPTLVSLPLRTLILSMVGPTSWPHINLITRGAPRLWSNLLCVDEHMLLEVLPPHKQLVTVITLEILLARMDHHVRLQVSLLGERLVTQSTPVVLLTCTLTQRITLWLKPPPASQDEQTPCECGAEAGVNRTVW